MKEELAFKNYLKKAGKKANVIERNVASVKLFIEYLQEFSQKDIEQTTPQDIANYVDKLESEKNSAKGYLYVLMNYFKFTKQDVLFKA
ncbi:MAG: site-specific integrase, partial [Candidatus Kariarchaeaceae archaeon]